MAGSNLAVSSLKHLRISFFKTTLRRVKDTRNEPPLLSEKIHLTDARKKKNIKNENENRKFQSMSVDDPNEILFPSPPSLFFL